jgi:hypothetical protein
MPTHRAYRSIVWPAVWPAAIVATLLVTTRHQLPVWDVRSTIVRSTPVLLHMGFGALLYVALFFQFGLPRAERQWVTTSVTEVLRRRRPAPVAAA